MNDGELMSTGPTEYDIRVIALTVAVNANSNDSPLTSTVLADAAEYASWLREGARADAALEDRIHRVIGSEPVTSSRRIDADKDTWGERTPCTRCNHSEGVHTTVHGCSALASDGDECGCTGYTTSAPSAPAPSGCSLYGRGHKPECTCTPEAGAPTPVHFDYRCIRTPGCTRMSGHAGDCISQASAS